MRPRLQPRAPQAATPCAPGCNPVRPRLQPRAPQAAAPSHVSRYSGESADELGPKLLEELQFVRDAFHPDPNPVPCTLTPTRTLTPTSTA